MRISEKGSRNSPDEDPERKYYKNMEFWNETMWWNSKGSKLQEQMVLFGLIGIRRKGYREKARSLPRKREIFVQKPNGRD